MSVRRRPTLLVRDAAGALAGLVSERDLVERALAAGLDARRPSSDVMSPAARAARRTGPPLAEAMEVMVRSGVPLAPVAGAVAARSSGSSPTTTCSSRTAARRSSTCGTSRRRGSARTSPRSGRGCLGSSARSCSRGRGSTASPGSSARSPTRRSGACSTWPSRRSALAPVPFVFLTLGSEGRREQTLVTDQDNAIVYADVPGARGARPRSTSAASASACARGSRRSGVEYCDGDVMASNPQWCQPLSVWKEYFRKWVRVPVPEAVLNSSIFFDFREVHGELALAAELREHVGRLLASRPGHVLQPARAGGGRHRSCRSGCFGRLSVETRGSREDVFDIKQPIARICELTRLQGLWHGVGATSTLERLQQLSQQGEVDARTCLDLKHAYSFLMQLRLARQVAALGDGGAPADNLVSTSEISTLERKLPRGGVRAHRACAGERAPEVPAHAREGGTHERALRPLGAAPASSGERPPARRRRSATRAGGRSARRTGRSRSAR